MNFFLQENGMKKNLGMGKLIEYEVKLVNDAMSELKGNIQKGIEFVANNPPCDQ